MTRRLSRRRKAMLIMVIVLIVLVVLAIYWLQSSNQGTITQSGLDQQSSVQQTTYKDLDTQYIHLSYLSTYIPHQLKATDNDLEIWQLDAATAYTKQLAITVSTLPDGTLKTSSAYLLRSVRPDLYSKRTVSLESEVVDVWVSQDRTEQTVFFTKNGRQTILAFTQKGGNLANLTEEVDAAIKSFRWK